MLTSKSIINQLNKGDNFDIIRQKIFLNFFSYNISNSLNIYFSVSDVKFTYSKENGLIETLYNLYFYNQEFNIIKPSDLPFLYNLSILCNLYNYDINDNIYSFSNIYKNQYFYCIEYSKFSENVKFGIEIYKLNNFGEVFEFKEFFFFDSKLININRSDINENNRKFNNNYIYIKYNQLLNQLMNKKSHSNTLISSYLQPPICFLKSSIALIEGKWYFNNIYENYFCFCKGKVCLNLMKITNYNYQSCKYYFYLTVIDKNKYIYPKSHYLLSDFFEPNIEPSDALPIFKEMIKSGLEAHYITMSWSVYKRYGIKNIKSLNDLKIIYGIRKLIGDVLEKYLELLLKLKVVVAAEKYDGIDNLFYNIDYIIYIFLGHGIQYIKSYLYNDYLSFKKYNKIVLPQSEKIISVAIEGGWKNEDIIKITCPKYDNYNIYNNSNISNCDYEKKERSIFLMFTWRKARRGKKISDLYFTNIYNLLNNANINNALNFHNVKLFFCYHHSLKIKKRININKTNIKFISQNKISTLLKNSSLIITDFSAILFDAIIQIKPLVLFIPDGLDPNLEKIYTKEYYETITKIKNNIINLYEVFLELNRAINKIIYYIKNGFILENEKLKFYQQFKLNNQGNTKKFIDYLKKM